MRIAVQGCSHGELDNIYDSILESEKHTGKKVDLLICCGDFQACRNENDMKAMKVPKKHQRIASFWKYYSGEATAPCLTIVIGGNHEASNYMWELYYGGWLAPNIYYLGSAGVVNVGGLRIGGISGIYKKFDYHKGHHEVPPLSTSEIVSIFHVRSLEVMRCKSITRPVDIFLSHDWPLGVYEFGDKDELLRRKPFFEEDIRNQELGSPPAAEILETVQPAYWFSGHLHVKFTAIIPHDEFGKSTRFLALDKCLPKRRFLQILDIGKELCNPPVLEYDEEWLTILHDTAKYFNPLNFDQKLPPYIRISEEQITACRTRFGSLIIPENFTVTAPIYRENADPDKYLPTTNPQTRLFCAKLGIKNESVPDENKEMIDEELNITHDSDADMSRDHSTSRDFDTSRDMSFYVGSVPEGDEKPPVDSKDLFKDFTAPAIKPAEESPKCSTPVSKTPLSKTKATPPVTLKRRLTLPEPINIGKSRDLGKPTETTADVGDSQIKPSKTIGDTIKNLTETDSTAQTEESPNEKEVSSEGLIEESSKEASHENKAEDENSASNPPQVSEEVMEESINDTTDQPQTDAIIPASETDVHVTETSSVDDVTPTTVDEDFNLEETDDDLVTKFLLLKKKFGRDQTSALSDSMVVNTSLSDPAIKDEVVKKKHEDDDDENEDKVKNKKFKMAVHNDMNF